MLGNTSGRQVPRCGCRFTPNPRENERPLASFTSRPPFDRLAATRETEMAQDEVTSYRNVESVRSHISSVNEFEIKNSRDL